MSALSLVCVQSWTLIIKEIYPREREGGDWVDAAITVVGANIDWEGSRLAGKPVQAARKSTAATSGTLICLMDVYPLNRNRSCFPERGGYF
jgi:hypothetical protein